MVLSSYFTLILDTKAPELKMYVPTYAQFGETVEFVVQCDEKLDAYKQNAYVMFDKNKYDIVLDYDEENNEYIGLFNTGMFPASSCSVHVELYDEVGNMGQADSSITLFSNKELQMEYDVDREQIKYSYLSRDIIYEIDKMGIDYKVEVMDFPIEIENISKMVVDFSVNTERDCH